MSKPRQSEIEIPEQDVKVFSNQPEINLGNIEAYSNAISQFRRKIVDLVDAKIMSEQTAARIILDQEYNFFQSMVTIEYK